MKINTGLRSVHQGYARVDQPSTQPAAQQNFYDVFHQQHKHPSHEQLNRILSQIQIQGQRLAKSMTIRELRSYKLLVKQFLEVSIHGGVGIKETRGRDRRGRGKRYKLVDEIDEQLLAMTDDLLVHEKGRVELLQRMGEIRGLLINLLF